MRILEVNKYHYPRGGADKYYLNITSSLKEAGHDVANFSMSHPSNLECQFSKYFPKRVSYNEDLGFINKLRIIGRVLYSFPVKRKFKKLVKDFKPEIIHIHNIYHHLSPSILTVAKKNKIPVVMHLHDYKLICPNHTLFVNGEVCERCRNYKYINCTKNKCLKNSFWGSLLATIEMWFHHRVLKIYEKNVDLFIAPSQFMKDISIKFGQKEKQIRVIHNPYSSDLVNEEIESKMGDYLLFFGRLSEEKGLYTLINALSATKERLIIVGQGPEYQGLQKRVDDLNVKVDFVGLKKGNELIELISNSKAVIIPSIWYENMPLSLLEAMNLEKVVIASKIGGLPELIENGRTGFLANPNDFRDLARVINSLNNYNLEEMGRLAKERVLELSPEKNTEEVLKTFKEILNY
ncbi:MAG: glycosyltransferase [Patescibacteria group bacterium]|jgi:glycosyltransferase involved in cell wall biosynthesis|nr:glycosyltransferase [Patescibacteria group bacterium]